MRFHYRVSWIMLNLVERALFGFKVTGRELVPRSGAVIIASNHVAYADPPVVGSAVPREVYFLAKEELFTNPVFGWLIRSYNAIALRRAVGDIGAVKKAVDLLKQGRAILMFPEGTRSLGGKLLKPKPGLGLIACMAGASVVPAYVTGTNRLSRVFLRRAKLAVSFGEPVEAAGFGGEAGGSRERYERLTEEVMKRIEDLAQEARPQA
ncbi:MAG TPA: lysophospholipid acyltransferase family protein [bacterium]|nr:lysophospholipid acyltransferase family protein [bacterium]